jgi:hypothetical protein
VIRQQERGLLVGESELTQDLEGLLARIGAHHTKALGVLTSQVAGKRLQDGGVIVNGQEHGFRRHSMIG